MRRARALSLCAALSCAVGASAARAQRVQPVAVRPVPLQAAPVAAGSPGPGNPAGDDGPIWQRLGGPSAAPRWAPLASLVVPGAGQFAMRQTRGAAYIAAEVYTWLVFREYARDARDRRAEYKRTARLVARRDFGASKDTSAWAYYEAVLDFDASGEYNLTPGPTLTPETDLTTYNGLKWLDARTLYWLDPNVPPPVSDPRYQRALAEYTATAVQGEFRWSWRNQGLSQQVYKDAIARENQVTRYKNAVINAMIVNHLLSSIDAFTSVRLRESRGPAGERRFEATVPWAPFGRGKRPRS